MPARAPRVWMARHGQTTWSRTGRHTSRTDVDLTATGEAEALALAPVASRLAPDLVLCSPRMRAQRTASLAGLVPYEVADDLREWDYGELEGMTTADIRAGLPGWSIWTGPWPGGESAAEVTERADRLIGWLRGTGAARVALVGHGHFGRVLAARWVGADVAAGGWLDLDTATWCEFGWTGDDPVVRHWNVPVAAAEPPG